MIGRLLLWLAVVSACFLGQPDEQSIRKCAAMLTQLRRATLREELPLAAETELPPLRGRLRSDAKFELRRELKRLLEIERTQLAPLRVHVEAQMDPHVEHCAEHADERLAAELPRAAQCLSLVREHLPTIAAMYRRATRLDAADPELVAAIAEMDGCFVCTGRRHRDHCEHVRHFLATTSFL